MKIGIVSSSGGSVLSAVKRILDEIGLSIEFFVVTDRECGTEKFCKENNIKCKRIENDNNNEFSKLSDHFFESNGGVNIIFMFFLRLVTEALYSKYPTVNIHPSLLPSFSGFNPIEKLSKRKSRYIGVTAHLVDSTIDNGDYIAQGIYPINTDASLASYHKISYVQKVYIMLVVIEQCLNKNLSFNLNKYKISYNNEPSFSSYFNPILNDTDWINKVNDFQKNENLFFNQ